MVITVRYYAAARAAAGVESEALEVPHDATLANALSAMRGVERTGSRSPEPGAPELSDVLRRCSFLVNEVAAKDPQRPLMAGDTLDVLPPFAGG
jgi:molybdopterin converting factor small subunit